MIFIDFPCKVDIVSIVYDSSYILSVTLNFLDAVDILVRALQIPTMKTSLYRTSNCKILDQGGGAVLEIWSTHATFSLNMSEVTLINQASRIGSINHLSLHVAGIIPKPPSFSLSI